MSRKAYEDKSTWKIPLVYAFVGDYGPLKVDHEPISDTLIWLCNSHKKNIDVERPKHPMYTFAGVSQKLLLIDNLPPHNISSSNNQTEIAFDKILVIDICNMFGNENNENNEDYDENEEEDAYKNEYQAALETENSSLELTKPLGKKLVKLFQKLILGENITMATEKELCPLLLKLIQQTKLLQPSITNVWLFSPELPTQYINTHLVVNSITPATTMGDPVTDYGKDKIITKIKRKHKAKGKKSHSNYSGSNPKKGTQSLTINTPIHVVVSSESTSRVCMLKPIFSTLTEIMFDGNDDDQNHNDYHPFFMIMHGSNFAQQFSSNSSSPHPHSKFDSEYCNDMGKMLFMSQMKVEMNKFSKQYERICTNVTMDLSKVYYLPQKKRNDGVVDWSQCERQVGALVVRGNKCLLVRNPENLEEGMRIPSVSPLSNEHPQDTAIRAIEEHAEVDAQEVQIIPNVMPVTAYSMMTSDSNSISPVMIEIFPLYATNAPPNHGSENYHDDEEDEEDLYDWYTFPRAMNKLNPTNTQETMTKVQISSVATALQIMALNLHQAASVGLVPVKWGGLFGQEFIMNQIAKQ